MTAAITVIADRFEGKRFNSPNDVVVKSDGSIWFTDPSYGILSDYEGEKAEPEMGCHVYRVDGTTGCPARVADDFVKPNGLAFSPDEKLLYIADTGVSHMPGGPKHIRRFNVSDDGKLSGGEVFAECTAGLFDGFRVDRAGRIWASSAEGVHCYDPDGTLIGKLHIPELVSNLASAGQSATGCSSRRTSRSMRSIWRSMARQPQPRPQFAVKFLRLAKAFHRRQPITAPGL